MTTTHSSRRTGVSRRVSVVGQLSCDTVVTLSTAIAIGAENVGSPTRTPGGTAAIVAHNVAALGGVTRFYGHVGRSPDDRAALAVLEARGVEFGNTVTTAHGLRVLVLVDPSGERTMIATGDRPNWSRLRLDLRSGDLVFFEGWHLFDPQGRTAYCALIEAAAAAGATVALDVCSASRITDGFAAVLANLPIDIVLANRDEAEILELLAAPCGRTVVVHRGTATTLLLHSGRLTAHQVRPANAVDTTGAGDTFAAGLLVALSRGADFSAAIANGHAAARSVVQIAGPLLPLPRPFGHQFAL